MMTTKITNSAICSKGTMALRIELSTTCKPANAIQPKTRNRSSRIDVHPTPAAAAAAAAAHGRSNTLHGQQCDRDGFHNRVTLTFDLSTSGSMHADVLLIAQVIFTRDSIYAIARICYGNFVSPSVCPSVCLSVCHTGGAVKNG